MTHRNIEMLELFQLAISYPKCGDRSGIRTLALSEDGKGVTPGHAELLGSHLVIIDAVQH